MLQDPLSESDLPNDGTETNSDSAVTILIVDDDMLIRVGLAATLNRIAGMSVIAEAGDGQTAIALAKELRRVLMDAE